MIHTLIVGRSGTGKSTVARIIAERSSKKVAVLDPESDQGWNADYISSDWQKFIEVVKRSKNIDVFVDESGRMISGREKGQSKAVEWLGTESRKHGIICHFIAQRLPQIPPNIRDQCGTLYLFSVSKSDAKTFADEWADDRLIKASELPPFYFYELKYGYKSRLGKINHDMTISYKKGDDANIPKRDITEL